MDSDWKIKTFAPSFVIQNYIIMQTIELIEAEIIEEFSMFEDWTDKYQYIIEMGQTLPSLSAEHKVEENLVRGCQSNVWLTANMENGLVTYKADSDAIITKGLIALLIRVLSHHSPVEILSSNLHFMEEIKLQDHLSPTRANGLTAMVQKMKLYAAAIHNS